MNQSGYSYPDIPLHSRLTPGSRVETLAGGEFRLSIPAGPAGEYRLAQLDDCRFLTRTKFNWQAPLCLSLKARVSATDLPGTWGFGLWNDPFSAKIGVGGATQRLPALPNAAWFFHASRMNHLTLRDDLPGSGFLSAVFASPTFTPLLLAPAALLLPFFAWSGGRRCLRRAARSLVQDVSRLIQVDETIWHDYQLICNSESTQFMVDNQVVLETGLLPKGRLSLVIWIDNQYAAFTPEGQLRYGAQENSDSPWLEISCLTIRQI